MRDFILKHKNISKHGFVIFLAAILMIMISGCKPKLVPAKIEVAPRISVIPKPAFVEEGYGEFAITQGFKIVVDGGNEEVKAVGEYFAEKLRKASGLDVPAVEMSGEIKPGEIAAGKRGSDNAMTMCLTGAYKDLGSEGYKLEINPSSIILEAQQTAGLFYGVQTLLQLLPPEVESVKSFKSRFPPLKSGTFPVIPTGECTWTAAATSFPNRSSRNTSIFSPCISSTPSTGI